MTPNHLKKIKNGDQISNALYYKSKLNKPNCIAKDLSDELTNKKSSKNDGIETIVLSSKRGRPKKDPNDPVKGRKDINEWLSSLDSLDIHPSEMMYIYYSEGLNQFSIVKTSKTLGKIQKMFRPKDSNIATN